MPYVLIIVDLLGKGCVRRCGGGFVGRIQAQAAIADPGPFMLFSAATVLFAVAAEEAHELGAGGAVFAEGAKDGAGHHL